jgi:hypothetical protein
VDSLEKHKKNCKMINGEKSKFNSHTDKSPEKGYSMPKEENLSKPRAAMCIIFDNFRSYMWETIWN